MAAILNIPEIQEIQDIIRKLDKSDISLAEKAQLEERMEKLEKLVEQKKEEATNKVKEQMENNDGVISMTEEAKEPKLIKEKVKLIEEEAYNYINNLVKNDIKVAVSLTCKLLGKFRGDKKSKKEE